jgi:hypothetical protein
MVRLAVYLPAADFYLRIPPVDAFIPMNMVFKSSRAPKMGGRCKLPYFWQASQTRMTCALTAAEDSDFWLRDQLAANKWYAKLSIDSLNLGEVANGHLGVHTDKIIGARWSGCTHTKCDLQSTFLQHTNLCVFHRLTFPPIYGIEKLKDKKK